MLYIDKVNKVGCVYSIGLVGWVAWRGVLGGEF